jgi:hypothetical protein
MGGLLRRDSARLAVSVSGEEGRQGLGISCLRRIRRIGDPQPQRLR